MRAKKSQPATRVIVSYPTGERFEETAEGERVAFLVNLARDLHPTATIETEEDA